MAKEAEFVKIIKEHEGIIFKITTIYTDNKNDQQDLYQEIVYQLWKGFDSFRNESKISTWMYRVAMNTAIGQLKKRKRNPGTLSMDKIVMQQTDSHDSLFEERLKQLYALIGQLNDLEKGLILLLLEGKKYEEIAEITGLTVTNVGTRIARIKTKLKSQMIKTN